MNPGSTNVVTTSGLIDGTALVGKATYTGKATGKFAISNPLNAANDDSGHFTADAVLKADFKAAAGSTLEGAIDKFRLKDGTTDPGWTVKLNEANSLNTNTWNGPNTEWHIGEIKGGKSGTWEALMYAGDNEGNNTPADVVGLFHSAIGSTHEMRGGFGAELEK